MSAKLWGAVTLCALAFLFHFTMTFLYVAPINPISLDLNAQISYYMEPLFQQNWRLFAPNPVSEERGMLVRARIKQVDGNILETEFYDFTSPLVEDIHSVRLFPPRRTRLVASIFQFLGFHDPIADRLRSRIDSLRIEEFIDKDGNIREEDFESLPLTAGEEAANLTAIELMQKVATEAAKDQWKGDILEIQIRIVVNQFPPFSERHSGERVGQLVVQDLEWIEAAR